MKQVFAIAVVIVWGSALVMLGSAIIDFLWIHPWWGSFLVAVPAFALPILAYFELRHSGEAHTLRAEANRLRAEQNGLQKQIGELTAELDAERNRHLQQGAASPTFAKGNMAYHATYSKPGSSERRTLYVYASKDGTNSFLLEASTGERATGDNGEISKRFSVLQIEYEAAGFERTASGTGGSLHRLFIR